MAVITAPYVVGVAGQLARVSSVQRLVDDIYTLQNGNIGSGNLATSGITVSSINACSVLTTKIDQQDMKLFVEVFSG